MVKNLLIIEKNPSGSIGLLKAKQRGLNIIFMGSNKFYNKVSANDLQYIDQFIEIDTNDDDLVLREVELLSKKIRITGVMTFMEFFVPLAAKAAEKLGLPGISVETAMCARYKNLMRDKLSKNHVPIPKYKTLSTVDDLMSAASSFVFPNIIKPVNMAGSRFVFKNFNADELKHNFEIIKKAIPPFGEKLQDVLLIEEYMEGEEFSVETISFQGKVTIVAITKKTIDTKSFVELGHTVPANIDKEQEQSISDLATKAVLALGILNGASHTEIIYTSEGPKIVEIAARLGGDNIPELVELASGIDMWSAFIDVSLGDKPNLVRKYRKSAAIGYITASAGAIQEINDSGKNPDYVQEVVISAKIGEVVRPLASSSDRLGYVIATGENGSEAWLRLSDRLSNIKILTSQPAS